MDKFYHVYAFFLKLDHSAVVSKAESMADKADLLVLLMVNFCKLILSRLLCSIFRCIRHYKETKNEVKKRYLTVNDDIYYLSHVMTGETSGGSGDDWRSALDRRICFVSILVIYIHTLRL